MNAPASQSQPYNLGRGFTVEFRLSGTRMDAIWSPDVPKGRRGGKLLASYQKARADFLGSIARQVGNVMVVDV